MHEKDVLNNPATSEWLRDALGAALKCDPVRVANDTEVLRSVLHERVARLESETAAVIQSREFQAECLSSSRNQGRAKLQR